MANGNKNRSKGILIQMSERLFGTNPSVFEGAESQRTDRVIVWLFQLGLSLLGIILIYGATFPDWSMKMHFIGWATAAAFMALMVGMALGLLFGLPSPQSAAVRRVEDAAQTAARPPGEPANGPPPDVPYNDSTSLEQIADWLTKIIVGLTLTQYPQWESRFEALAQNLTATLLDRPSALPNCIAQVGVLAGRATPSQQAAHAAALRACDDRFGDMIPGGLILIAYALLGFSMAYLWMRRYFIIEMVTARVNARRAMEVRAEAASSEARTRAAEERANKAEADAKIALADKQMAQAEKERALTELEAQRALLKANQESVITEGNAARTAVGVPALAAIIKQAQTVAPVGSGAGAALAALLDKLKATPPTYPDDPWRGNFGDTAEANGFRLEGHVSETVNPNTFQVEMTVSATTEAAKAAVLGQSAWFFLHPTFDSGPLKVAFDKEGKAYLKVYAYGGFTVGAMTEDGTLLELDLAALPNVPPLFRQR